MWNDRGLEGALGVAGYDSKQEGKAAKTFNVIDLGTKDIHSFRSEPGLHPESRQYLSPPKQTLTGNRWVCLNE
jgi:hypothetical protein